MFVISNVTILYKASNAVIQTSTNQHASCINYHYFIELCNTLCRLTLKNSFNPYWQISGKFLENFWDRFTGKLIQTKYYIWFIYVFSQKNRMEEFSSKTFCSTPQNWKKLNMYSWFLMDEFSIETACVTTRKMKIL